MVLIMFFIGLLSICWVSSWFEVFSLIMFFLIFWLFCGYGVFGVLSSYLFSYDMFGWSLVMLSLWIGGLMLLASILSLSSYYKSEFVMFVVFLTMFLSYTFVVYDYMSFYIYFESSLIPIFILVMGWGYQPERLQAGYYLLFYTLMGSLPLLISILYLWEYNFSLCYYMCFYESVSLMLFIGMVAGFLVKMPMFMVHLWLPKAHVEAPISGSMMLAGVLLKLGGYGLIRVLCIFKSVLSCWGHYLVSLSLVSFVCMGLLCMRQFDLKSLIAYSSVAHMSIVIGGLMVYSSWGFSSSLIMMLGHGLCSSGLFCLANISYERLGSRSLFVNSGLLLMFPNLCMWWFMLCACNMAAPPSMNLLGEIGLMITILGWSSISGVVLFLGSFFSGCYTVYMYAITQHGKSMVSFPMLSGSVREYILLLLHWVPLNFVFLNINLVLFM